MTQNLEKEKLKMLVCFNTQETTTDCNRLINKNLILQNVASSYKIRFTGFQAFVCSLLLLF